MKRKVLAVVQRDIEVSDEDPRVCGSQCGGLFGEANYWCDFFATSLSAASDSKPELQEYLRCNACITAKRV